MQAAAIQPSATSIRKPMPSTELRIESFFPADEATRTVMKRLAEEALYC